MNKYLCYLPKMLKPKAVSLRISLWRLFYQLATNQNIPRSGLNYLIDKIYNQVIFDEPPPIGCFVLLIAAIIIFVIIKNSLNLFYNNLHDTERKKSR